VRLSRRSPRSGRSRRPTSCIRRRTRSHAWNRERDSFSFCGAKPTRRDTTSVVHKRG
jgi:hypothetical protein